MADYHFSPRRSLGRTGFIATRLGIGGLADPNVPIEDCIATVRRAMDAGLNVIDTAPGDQDGCSEEIVGRAMDGRRQGMFVIDKIDHPDQPVAPQIDASLQRMRMEMVDLFVFHDVSTMSGWHALTARAGGMHQLEQCVMTGKVRFMGISSHHPKVLKAAVDSGLCDVVMFPVGPFVDARYITEVLPAARKHNVGTVGFKVFGAGKLLGDTTGYGRPLSGRPRGTVSAGGSAEAEPSLRRLSVEQCLNYTLTCDPDVALLGMSFPNEQDAAFAATNAFTSLNEARMDAIRLLAREAIEGKGDCWWNP
ncbi:MAG: aldo/keto reductase [Planctomycetes bacterium]|jgi:aryl-alcohol dehydrogenase-like predicted oxidoreductase|nr:aldo/keto reductase [Planctomycetota bacterium]